MSSAVDLHPRPTRELIELGIAAAGAAVDSDLSAIAARCDPHLARWIELWPGEHYKLLAGLVSVVKPASVVEIGTFQGPGSLALLHGLPEQSHLVTFDVIPWAEIEGTVLRPEDFAGGRIQQRIGDLSDPEVFAQHRDVLLEADLVFMDAPKDGVFEPAFLELAVPLWRGSRRLLVIDDIRLAPMLQLWRDLPFPKLDLTSFGHWSGTGIALTS